MPCSAWHWSPPVAAQTAKKAQPAAQPIVVYKTATCGCCGKWVDHLKAAGFAPTVHTLQTMDEAPVRKRIPEPLRSCHTATLEGYLVEGHVPAGRHPQAAEGEAARGRHRGAGHAGRLAGNGVEPNPQPYDVLTFDAGGKTSVFAKR